MAVEEDSAATHIKHKLKAAPALYRFIFTSALRGLSRSLLVLGLDLELDLELFREVEDSLEPAGPGDGVEGGLTSLDLDLARLEGGQGVEIGTTSRLARLEGTLFSTVGEL